MFTKRKVEDVFTPRNPDVNNIMYVHRPELEKVLYRKILGSKHMIIYGESGCGKSWLYKKVLAEQRINYGLINLAKAKRMGSITNVFKDQLANRINYEKTEYTDVKRASANALAFNGGLENRNTFKKMDIDPIRDIRYISGFYLF
ncbi:hypothetical protein [Vallitalea sp.]|uniref:hypothetical protein n=1 Tax=Vallitalea sp. TaxID=1882829 RepID=UPI0025E90A30|nr:hypothetical protein [Vallitalea sp.]MCT4687503.1 hypothetical protein [Vallitalea sp.]